MITNINSHTKIINSKVLLAFALLVFLGISMYAGTTDTLGLSDSYSSFSSWTEDTNMLRMVTFILVILMIASLVAGRYGMLLVLLIISAVIYKLKNVVEAIASATF
jgi:Mg2+ and Co2+ transporter CorA